MVSGGAEAAFGLGRGSTLVFRSVLHQVSLMVLHREGARMVAKLEVEDPHVRPEAQDGLTPGQAL